MLFALLLYNFFIVWFYYIMIAEEKPFLAGSRKMKRNPSKN